MKTASSGSVFGGSETGRGPFQMSAMLSSMNDTPIAVISGASRGALRKRFVRDPFDRRVEEAAADGRQGQRYENRRGQRLSDAFVPRPNT